MSLLGHEAKGGGAKPNARWRLLIRQRRAGGGSVEQAGGVVRDRGGAEFEGAGLEALAPASPLL